MSEFARRLAKRIEEHPLRCACGHQKMIHQFGPCHPKGTCTIAGCTCSQFVVDLAARKRR